MLYLAKGGFWITLGQGISTIAGLALAVGFANLISKEVYGTYSFILSLAGVISVLTLTGTRTAMTQAVARGFEGTLRASFWMSIRWSIFMVLAGFGGGLYYYLNGNIVLALSLLIVGSCSPLMVSAALYSGFLNGKKEFRVGTVFNSVTNVLPAAALLSTIALTDDILHIILVYFISNTAVNVYFYFRTLRMFKPNDKVDPTTDSYTKHLSFLNMLSTGADYLDKILIFHYLGAAQLAVYAFAIAVPTHLRGLLRNVNSLIAPKFAANDKNVVQKSLGEKMIKTALVSSLSVGLYIVAAPYLFKIFFPLYLDSIFYSQLFSLMIIPATVGIISAAFLEAHKEQRALYITRIASPIMRILLLVVFGYFWGITGIIVGGIVAKTGMVVLTNILAQRV